MTYHSPPFLRPGDTIGIISTARKLTPKEIEPAIEVIEAWGFNIKKGPHLHKEYHQFSGTDQERAADMQMMLEDPTVKAIYCARGGYGSVRIIDHVRWEVLNEHPKWILGYSDVTALHNHLHTNLGIRSIHAPMPLGFAENTRACLEDVRSTLVGELKTIMADRHSFNREGKAVGALTGGNISVLYSQRGTPADIDVRGKILFIEDLDEYLYHIDRMMMNFSRAGWFDVIAGLIVGGLTDMNDNTVPFGKQAIEIVREHVSGRPFPVAFGFPAGHVEDNRPLIFGAEVELNVTSGGSFVTYSA
ncbi:MAG: LD-carboxypeptidase [Flavobacteriales bacterium]|nr:LD-carboxypeptidase [Flavobacteriales bacterium]